MIPICYLLSVSFVEYISICPKMTHFACTSAVKNPVCVSRNQICDFNRDCPGGEDESDCLAYNRCDFQKGMCDWVAAKHSFFEWERYYDNGMYQSYSATNFCSRSLLISVVHHNELLMIISIYLRIY